MRSAYGPEAPKVEQSTLDQPVRCPNCNKLLLELASRPWRATCPRCRCQAEATDEGVRILKPGTAHR